MTRKLLLASVALVMTACTASPRVVRVYDGKIASGRYVPPEAYAAFLRGMLAEESGDLNAAVFAYTEAADADGSDPAIWTRIGEARCRRDPRDREVDRAFARALEHDPLYAGAVAAQSRCALARGHAAEAATLAHRAFALDPTNIDIDVLVVHAEAAGPTPAGDERAVALTVAHGDRPAAWDALVAWGRGRRDAGLVARGFAGLVRAAPARSLEAEGGALALLAGGHLVLARQVAVAVADAPHELGVIGPRDPSVARLAVDEALARGDRATALARAIRGHVDLAEVAGRAVLLDHQEIALAIAADMSAADPAATGPQMVKALARPEGVPVKDRLMDRVTDRPPEVCALLFAARLFRTAGVEVARAWLARVPRTPMALRDPLVGGFAVALATQGVLPATDLPASLRAEVERARSAE